ncbi:MAG: amino acid permease, partial [Acidobacteria bacterium]|nr:amino acid permease [Acidobacteriota bacterium]
MKPIGFWTAVALVVGNMIGSGVFLLPASLAKYGGIGLLGWLVSTIGAVLLALVFARLARLDPAAGGPYAYTRRAFGDLAGFLVAWGYWISCWCTNAALAVAFVGYLDPFFPTVVRQPAAAALMAIATVWLLTAVNIRGVRAAGQV